MTDVRERVARAILETDPTCSYDACREKYERMHEGSVERNWWDHLHEQADAALSACGHREMREALEKRYWLEFLDFLRCSSSNAVASKASGKSLAPSEEKSFEKALALLAGNTPKRSSRSASAKS